MIFLYPFIFFLLVPLLFLYLQTKSIQKYKQREKKLIFLSLAFIIMALSRPVIPNSLNKQKFEAEDFIVALDVSYSMQAKDLSPTRYAVAKQNLKEILQALPKNRFSLFAFTSNALLISPPTTDTAISIMALDALEPSYILTQGTSLSSLLKTIAKSSFEEKNLIIFSDGGEEHNLDTLVTLAKENHITPYVVATGSTTGAILSKNNKKLKDENNNLVISRINPILQNFASLSGGKYYELQASNANIVQELVSDLTEKEQATQKSEINVLSYREFFQFPLFIALVLFILSVTKLHQIYVLIPLLFLPHQAKANLFDFYYLHQAKQDFQEQEYIKSAQGFYKLSPSVESYYNEAVSYYKAKDYRVAVDIFSKIKTTNPELKQKIYYNMGNCAVKYGKFDRAKVYYKNALNLGYDKQSYDNLTLLESLNAKEKRDLTDMLRKQIKKKQNTASQKKKSDKAKKQKNSKKNSSSKANQKASQKSNGSSNAKKKKTQEATKNTDKISNAQYKVGYKAYELINKGYTNEKHPW